MMKVYLDNAATTKVSDDVINEMHCYNRDEFFNSKYVLIFLVSKYLIFISFHF